MSTGQCPLRALAPLCVSLRNGAISTGATFANLTPGLRMNPWHSGSQRARQAVTALAVLVIASLPSPAASQTRDFLFGPPHGSVAVRGTFTFANAGSDLYDFVTSELTIDKTDFNMPGIGFDFAYQFARRLDAQFGFEWGKTKTTSEYRDFVDNNFLPINQTTSLKIVHLTGSVRLALTERGYEVSSLAWVPRRVVPYVGAGGGAVYYDFAQSGDFVDFVNLSVFPDAFRSKGWAPSAHAFGGVDVRLFRGLYASVEGRYTTAKAKLEADFIDFDPLDLSGFRLAAGINVLF
jgi:hypothetical protein